MHPKPNLCTIPKLSVLFSKIIYESLSILPEKLKYDNSIFVGQAVLKFLSKPYSALFDQVPLSLLKYQCHFGVLRQFASRCSQFFS